MAEQAAFHSTVLEARPPVQELQEPVKNLVRRANSLLYMRGAVTKDTPIKTPDNPDGIRRPLFLRARRARILQEIKDLPDGSKIEKRALLEKAKAVDYIAQQYLNQSELSVLVGGLGVQKAKSIEINPPPAMVNPGDEMKPPIFVIPGIANDLECVGNFLTEIALSGRKVISVGYPDSFNGSITEEFAAAVVTDEAYGPHTAFFKATVDHFTTGIDEKEIWGYSTGGAILAEMLCDPKYQEAVTKAVFVNPASAVDQTESSVKMGVMRDIAFIKEKGTLPGLTWTTGLIDAERAQISKEMRKKSFNGELAHIATKSKAWQVAKVKEGGSMTVVTCGNDKVTKTSEAGDAFKNMNVITVPDGYHATAMVQPERIIPQILAAK